MKLLIINGPNLNLIGRREVDVYGKENLDQIIEWVSENIKSSEVDLIWFQSNSEGEIIDKRIGPQMGRLDRQFVFACDSV